MHAAPERHEPWSAVLEVRNSKWNKIMPDGPGASRSSPTPFGSDIASWLFGAGLFGTGLFGTGLLGAGLFGAGLSGAGLFGVVLLAPPWDMLGVGFCLLYSAASANESNFAVALPCITFFVRKCCHRFHSGTSAA